MRSTIPTAPWEPKVSLISPCYNGENYLTRFLDSLLVQTYTNVEFIFVDDGSTDKTSDIFESYRKQLEDKGWSVIYIWQENQGAAGALNTGLKKFTGDYLIWPDSDDILYPDHIRCKVDFMECNKNIGIGYCSFDYVYEDDIDNIFYTKKPLENVNMFNELIDCNPRVVWTLGTIIRTTAFLAVNPQRDIPVCRGGQNCQIQLPVVYQYPYGVIHKSLAKYVVRSNSHSHAPYNFFRRQYELAEVWIKSIARLPCNSAQKYTLYLRVILRFLKELLIKHPLRCIYKRLIKIYISIRK